MTSSCLFYYSCVLCVLPVCVHSWYLQSQKNASDLLELELETVLNYCVCAGNQTWVPQ